VRKHEAAVEERNAWHDALAVGIAAADVDTDAPRWSLPG
jgi:hypothetical protein